MNNHNFFLSSFFPNCSTFQFAKYGAIRIQQNSFYIPIEHAFLLFPTIFRTFSSNDLYFSIEETFPIVIKSKPVISAMQELQNLICNKSSMFIQPNDVLLYSFIAEKFDNYYLKQIVNRILEINDCCSFNLPPLHYLPYTIQEFSILDDFILKVNDFTLHLNKFFLSNVSQLVHEKLLENFEFGKLKIQLHEFDLIEQCVKEFEFVFKGRVLNITNQNFEFLRQIARILKMKQLAQTCFDFEKEEKEKQILFSIFPEETPNFPCTLR